MADFVQTTVNKTAVRDLETPLRFPASAGYDFGRITAPGRRARDDRRGVGPAASDTFALLR